MRLVDTTAAGRRLHTWNDLLSTFPNLLGVKTGHTNGAGWSQVAAARGGGVTIYATLLGGETREGRNADLAALLALGALPLPDRLGDRRQRGRTARCGPRTGSPPCASSPRKPALRVIHVERPLVERVVLPVEAALPVRKGQRLGEVQVLDRGTVIARSPLVAAAAVERPGASGA